eukprot:3839316-Alexandrium_andersonii.AAC.1
MHRVARRGHQMGGLQPGERTGPRKAQPERGLWIDGGEALHFQAFFRAHVAVVLGGPRKVGLRQGRDTLRDSSEDDVLADVVERVVATSNAPGARLLETV